MANLIKDKGYSLLGMEKPTKVRKEIQNICGIIR